MTGERYDEETRWPMLVQQHLGDRYRVIEEGLNGRTTVFDDPLGPGRNGVAYLGPCLQSHAPLNLVIVMLGTNDLKKRFSLTPEEITQGMEMLLNIIEQSDSGAGSAKPDVLILAPPILENIPVLNYAFFGMEEKSRQLGAAYGELAERRKCSFLDIGSFVTAGGADGVHLTEAEHRRIAELVTTKILEIP